MLGVAAELIERFGLKVAEDRMLAQHRQFAAHHAARTTRVVYARDGFSYGPLRSHSPIAFLGLPFSPDSTLSPETGTDKRKNQPATLQAAILQEFRLQGFSQTANHLTEP